MSVVFYGPELAVETFFLRLSASSGRTVQTAISSNPTLVKGCEQRFAIEDVDAMRLRTLAFYREDGPSLVWDEQEGAVTYPASVRERIDDPADFASESRNETSGSRSGLLDQAVRSVSQTSLKVTERERTSQPSIAYRFNHSLMIPQAPFSAAC
ncbi:MAG: hypothetical protein OXH38_11090 [Chloroflexi bacterium]|nr:hypothetical protein [Chloroflexota bacterium]